MIRQVEVMFKAPITGIHGEALVIHAEPYYVSDQHREYRLHLFEEGKSGQAIDTFDSIECDNGVQSQRASTMSQVELYAHGTVQGMKDDPNALCDFFPRYKDRVDAQRWQKLMSCERFRVWGTARLGDPDAHIGMELWAKYPLDDEDSRRNHGGSKSTFVEFVDGLDPA